MAVAYIVGAGSFWNRYSNRHIKQTYRQLQKSRDYF